MTVAEQIGRNLRRIRRAADLSQDACAERAEIHRTSLPLYEWGLREPMPINLVKIAGALEVDPVNLLAGVRWEFGSHGGGRFVFDQKNR